MAKASTVTRIVDSNLRRQLLGRWVPKEVLIGHLAKHLATCLDGEFKGSLLTVLADRERCNLGGGASDLEASLPNAIWLTRRFAASDSGDARRLQIFVLGE